MSKAQQRLTSEKANGAAAARGAKKEGYGRGAHKSYNPWKRGAERSCWIRGWFSEFGQ